VALGEAKVEAAIPVLLSMADMVNKSGGVVWEAGVYALQRMGAPALMATMTHIENATEPEARISEYWILHAATDADEPTRLAVQEFALPRAKIELQLLREKKDWYPVRAALSVSAALGDQRAKPMLEELTSQAKSSGEDEEAEELSFLLDDLASGKRRDYDVDWRTDWEEQCGEWDGMLQEWRQQEAAAAKREELKKAHAELAEGYRQSLVQQGIPADKAAVAKEKVKDWLDLAAKYDLDLRKPNLKLTRKVLMEDAPAELLGDRHYFEGLPSLLEAFFVFLHNAGRVKNLKPYEQLFKEARESLPELAMDRNLWGMRKLMYVVGTEQGYDMSDDAEAAEFVQNLTQSVVAKPAKDEPTEAAPVDEYHGDRIEPIRRTEPKVGRNDPCPCGSGKKYKKCCGK
jgi:hypothetical protein